MNKIKKIALFSSVPILSGFGFLQFQSFQNNRDHLKRIKDEQELKDSTRPDYEFFGLNWGANSDQQILDESDTGDFVFSSVACKKLYSASEIGRCYVSNVMQLGFHKEADLMGILVRDSEEVYVVYSYLGKVDYLKYSEFINLGYHR
jgi:hypothetical protein